MNCQQDHMPRCFGGLRRVVFRQIMLSAGMLSLVSVSLAAEPARLAITVHDEHGRTLPARVHLVDEQGKAHKAAGLPSWNDHFVCSGEVELNVAPGTYRYEIERGPEYRRAAGQLTVRAHSPAQLKVRLERLAHLRQDGWYSADLHVHRDPDDVELLMQAEDLDFAPVITWWNKTNRWEGREIPAPIVRRFDSHRFYTLMAGEDERGGGALLFFRLPEPLKIDHATREVPSPLRFVELARRQHPQVWIDIEKPFWWDVPVWLASGTANSIGIANNHMNRGGMFPNEAWGRPRDAQRLPAPLGNGYWTQEIYYHALNSGIRLPPSAGSASGVLPNPVGYNRVYVHVGGPFHPDRWWDRLSAGQCFVTNGPLLICRANMQWPGAEFQPNGPLRLQLEIQLTSTDSIPAIEVVKNGSVVKRVPCTQQTSQTLACEIDFSDSGWFLVRAIADRDETFRFASTGPFYVQQKDSPPRISRASCRFFLEWVEQRIEMLQRELRDHDERDNVLSYHHQAHRFWTDRLKQARAD